MKKVVDPDSFVLLSNVWGKDKYHVYCDFKPLLNIDLVSFKFLFSTKNGDWATDKKYLYFNGDPIKNIDGASFQFLNEFWGMDAESVFSFQTGRVRSKIDASTFKVIDDQGSCEDKDFIYRFNNCGELKKVRK
jgi:hypothetical protein